MSICAVYAPAVNEAVWAVNIAHLTTPVVPEGFDIVVEIIDVAKSVLVTVSVMVSKLSRSAAEPVSLSIIVIS